MIETASQLPSFAAVLSRRRFLLSSLGAAAVVPAACGEAPSAARSPSGPVRRPLGLDGVFFGAVALSALAAMCDLIIPDTDTPGAVAAGVPAFVDGLMEGWADQETQTQAGAAMDWLLAESRAVGGIGFAGLIAADKSRVLSAIDMGAFEDGVLNSEVAAGYRILKRAIFEGYYLSEIGATAELRYLSVPGGFDGDVPLSAVGRTWAE